MIPNNCRIGFRRIVTSLDKPLCEGKIRPFQDMPGPKPLPFIGNLWRYLPIIGEYSFDRLHTSYEKMYEKYGPVIRENIFGKRVLVHVFHPNDIRTVYDSAGSKPVRVSHTALEKYRRDRPHLYSGPGLFPSNGEEWYRFRRLFQKLLLTSSTAEGCSRALEDVTDELIANIPKYLDGNMEMDLQPMLFSWALECIGVITLNRRLGCLSANGNKEGAVLVKAANDTHTAVYHTENTPFSFRSYKKLEAAQNLLSGIVQKYLDQAIEDSKCGKNEHSIVSKMLQIEGADKKDVFTMILDMFMAGIDTTAFTLSFGLYNLAMNRDAQSKLREELIENLPSTDTRVTGNKSKFTYLRAVIEETLRVNPVSIGTGRIIQSDLVLGGYKVPAQTMVVLQHQVASRMDEFFPNPLRFEPERWIRKEFFPLVSSPFGFGARMCVGKKLAMRELHLGFAKMVRNFDITYHYETIDSVNRLINVPDKPLRLRLQKIEK